MKKIIFFIIIILLIFFIGTDIQKGIFDNAEVYIGQSLKFNKEEINSAINTVKKEFENYKGCKLTKIWYNEKKSNKFIKKYLQDNKRNLTSGLKHENVIVLYSSFDVDSKGYGGLNPDSTYSYWNWILIRDDKTSNWKIIDWGY